MPGGVCIRSLGQLDEFAPKYIVHLQPSRNFTGDIQPLRAAHIDVHFLKEQDVRVRLSQELQNGRQLQTTVNIPVHNANGTARPCKPSEWREILGNDFRRWHKSKDPCGKLWENALLGETQVQGIIDLGPCQFISTAESYSNPFVREFLYGNVKKYVDLPAANEMLHLRSKLAEDGLIKDGDANVSSAELVSGNFLAHLDHSVAGDNHLHCFIPPAGINNHRNRGGGPRGCLKNLRIKNHIGIQDHE